jgi:L-fuconolactonase
MRVVDAHHHLWDPEAVAYDLLRPVGPLAALAVRHDATTFDAAAREHDVTAAIAVEATSAGADPEAETHWLLDQVARSTVTQAVVAWAPLEDPAVDPYLDRLLARGRTAGVDIVGVRRSFEAVPDGFIAQESVARGVRAAAARGLVVDLVLFGHRLAEVVELVARVPEATFVLDHLGKPRMDERSLAAWRQDIVRLVRYPNVVAKISGLTSAATGADWEDELAPLVDHASATFGWDRLMFASDWPICDLAGGYGRWLDLLRAMTHDAGAAAQAAFFAGTADRTYRLGDQLTGGAVTRSATT